MKINLLYPEVYEIARFGKKRKEYPPFGVMYLATVAEKLGFNVKITAVTSENRYIDLTEYDIVWYSLSSSCTYDMMLNSKKYSSFSSHVKIIVGGIHASLYPVQTKSDFCADCLIIGEGEIALDHILKVLLGDISCINMKGILYDGSNELIPAPYVKNLDELGFPARHLLPYEDIIMNNRLSKTKLKMTHILASRGCPFSCYFCGGIIKNHRYRSSENICREIEFLREQYGVEGFAINDENFTINKNKVIEICKKIEEMKMPWSALSRVDTLDEDVIRALSNANCIELKFGLESGSDVMLNNMNKVFNIQQAQKTFEMCNEYGILVKAFLIHGFPGENEETTDQTISFLKKNKTYINRVTLFRWTPIPGSYVYNHADDYGLQKNKLTYSNAVIYSNAGDWFNDCQTNNIINKSYEKIKYEIDNIDFGK